MAVLDTEEGGRAWLYCIKDGALDKARPASQHWLLGEILMVG